MTTSDYIINSLFILIVLRQARERPLDARSLLGPLAIVAFVVQMYVHSIPTAGNDLPFVALLAGAGLLLGVASGFATHVRVASDGRARARVGWVAGALLVLGIGSRVGFALAVEHGAGAAVSSFSIANHIDSGAWPLAFVAMAMVEVVTRLLLVHARGHRMASTGSRARLALAEA